MMDIGAHLLIVDDDERIRGLLQKFLIRNGFMVHRRARRGPCAAASGRARFRPDRAGRDDAGRGRPVS
jgi:DNA-binding response OmpR family regulator